MAEFDIIVYGATGFTGRLVAEYFTNNYQNLALSLYATIALFFVVSQLLTLTNRPLILHSSYKKVNLSVIIILSYLS